MTDISEPSFATLAIKPRRLSPEASNQRTRERYARERRYRLIGLGAVVLSLGLLALLLLTILAQGYTAFVQTTIRLPVTLSADVIDPDGSKDPADIGKANYGKLINEALYQRFPNVEERRDKKALRALVSKGAALDLRQKVLNDPELIGQTIEVDLLAAADVDQFEKGYVDPHAPEANRRLKDRDLAWIETLQQEGRIDTVFNRWLFTRGDSREPEYAGIWGAVVGSAYMMLVTILVSLPLGVGAAIYLEEFAPKNSRWVDLIEINVNNLAAVPSIVFGLLGLAVFLGLFGMPRSAPLVGGLTLSLMTLPTIVVVTRAALRAVPPSIREAALGVGASKLQVVSHHVLPLALPGILTGAIIGMARALGETAPLLMIGMIAFIVDIPQGPTDPATALPVQVYLWADSPERAFAERTAAAILVLLGFLMAMNAIAVFLRQRFQVKW
ncbi:MAG: phosphate ABC transporter permease PstA [Alphaproteobacteria bacterium]